MQYVPSPEYCHFVMTDNNIFKNRQVVFLCIKLFLFYPNIQVVSYNSPDYSSNNMGEVRYIILHEEPFQYLLANEADGNKDHGDRDLACIETCERSQQDKCKNNATGPTKSCVSEKDEIHKTGCQCCNSYHKYHIPAAILFLKHRAEKQNISHIPNKVLPAAVAQHMSKQTEIG